MTTTLLLCLVSALALTASADLSVNEWTRHVDLSSQLVKTVNHIVLKNSAGSGPAKEFTFRVEDAFKDKVIHIGATVKSGSERTYLRVTATPKQPGSWSVELKKPLPADATAAVEVEVVLAKAVEMHPAEITQRERQLVLFEGNHYAYTPYKVKTQTTKFGLPSASVESYSKSLKPASLSDATITYGPYADVQPLAEEPLSIHYENNNPFLLVTRLERTIELSMWGNIAVEETVDIRHAGASLKGSFSRYEFQRENSGVSSVKHFKTVLPAAASDVYYRDDIGNISTSALRVLDDAVELELRPRFPLFGGWKTHYVVGYNVPSYEYLFAKGDKFALNMRLLDHVYDDMVVEDMTVKIILPEGAKVGKFHSPYPTSRQADSLHFTYLDTIGRPVVSVVNMADLTEKHIQDFQLEFDFPKTAMVREPLLLVAAFFIFFLLTIVYVRLDFSIAKDDASETRMKVSGLAEKTLSHQDRKSTLYTQYDDALARLKSSKDSNAFASASSKVQAEQKQETQAVTEIGQEMRKVAADVADKMAEMLRQDKILREHQASQATLVEKLVSGKLTKQQFIDQESALIRKKDECVQKINQARAYLRAL